VRREDARQAGNSALATDQPPRAGPARPQAGAPTPVRVGGASAAATACSNVSARPAAQAASYRSATIAERRAAPARSRAARSTTGPSAPHGRLRWLSAETPPSAERPGRGLSADHPSPAGGGTAGREAGVVGPLSASAWLRVPPRDRRLPACPSPHQLGEHELGAGPEHERPWIAAHLRDCPGCAAEQEVLRSFLAAPPI
jgi:hypothetical protein